VNNMTAIATQFALIGQLEAQFSADAKHAAVVNLMKDGASHEDAERAVDAIVREAASYIAFGPFKAVPDRQVRAEIAAVERSAAQLLRHINAMSPDAWARLKMALSPPRPPSLLGRSLRREPLQGRGNADPIYEVPSDSPAGLAALGSMLGARIAIPADLGAKFDRVHFDLFHLIAPLGRARDFRARRGRPENWRVRRFFEAAIVQWASAAGQAPSAGQRDGQANSPLLHFLRALVYPVATDQDVKEAVTDAVYLDVLAKLKKRRRGLLQRPVLAERRRRSGQNKG